MLQNQNKTETTKEEEITDMDQTLETDKEVGETEETEEIEEIEEIETEEKTEKEEIDLMMIPTDPAHLVKERRLI